MIPHSPSSFVPSYLRRDAGMAVNPGLRRSGRIYHGFARRPRDQRDLRARASEQRGADRAGSHGEDEKIVKSDTFGCLLRTHPVLHV